MKKVTVSYVGWTYEGNKHVKKVLTYTGSVVRESEKLLAIRGDCGIATIRKALIVDRKEEEA